MGLLPKPRKFIRRIGLLFIAAAILFFGLYITLWIQRQEPVNQIKIDPGHPVLAEKSSKYDHIAIAVKTGHEVAFERLPSLLVTFLSNVNNLVLVGDSPKLNVGSKSVVDVLSDILEEMQARKNPSKEKVKDISKRLYKRANTEASKQNNASLGWKTDTHKNLPAYRLLYDTYPNAQWYMMIDDDTYVFMDNLVDSLSKFDPNEDHYLGLANFYRGCGGVRKFSPENLFAHGGSGIVLSRGAMVEMYPNIHKCIIQSEKCWAGDVRVALCLRDLGIKVKSSRSFIIDPPNDKLNFTNACAKPVTFHHLLGKQVQKMYDLELEVENEVGKKSVTMGHVASKFLSEKILENTNRPGKVYSSQIADSVNNCQLMCRLSRYCVAYTFEQKQLKGVCHLMENIIGIRTDSSFGNYTGLILPNFRCQKSWRTIFIPGS